MAISAIATRSSGTSSTNNTTVTQTPGATVAVGRVLVTFVSSNSTTAVSSITDAVGNTWDFLGAYSHSGGNPRVEVWICHVKTQLSSSTTITVTFSGNVAQKAVASYEYSVGTGKLLALTTEASSQTSQVSAANGFGSSSFSSLTSKQRLYVRCCTKQANSTGTITASSNFTSWGLAVRSQNNAAAVLPRAEHRINTSTDETSNPTFNVSGNTAGLFLALEEVDAPPTVTSVAPSSGADNATQAVTITGTGFLSGATVTLWRGGTQVGTATSVSVDSSTSITCTFPALSAGKVDVLVTNTDAQDSGTSGADAYEYKVLTAVEIAMGSDLLAFFGPNASGTSWAPHAVRSGVTCSNLAQATSGNRPTVEQTDGGNDWLNFDGTNDYLQGAVMSGLPTYNGSSGKWIFACVFQRTGEGEIFQRLCDFDGHDEMLLFIGGRLQSGSAQSDANPIDTTTAHRLIVVATPSSGSSAACEMWIDGAKQANEQASGRPLLGSHFAGPHGIGARESTGGDPFMGKAGCFVWGQAASFDSTKIAALDAALEEWLDGAGGEDGAISGSALGTSAASATLRGAGALSGASSASASTSATLRGTGALSGTSAGTSTTTGDLRAYSAISGSAEGTSSATGTLRGSGKLAGASAGTSAAAATAKGVGALSGTAAGTSSASANATAFRFASGAAEGSSTASGTLRGAGALAGVGAGAASASATLRATAKLSGSSAGAATTTATLRGAGALAGTSPGSSTATADLRGEGKLAGASAGAATVTGALRATGALGGTSAGSSSASATLKGSGQLSGASDGASTAAASLKGAGALRGVAAGTSTAIAHSGAPGSMRGSAAGSSTASGRLKGAARLSGAAAGFALAAGVLLGVGALSGTSSGTSSSVGVLRGAGALAGWASGASTATGALTGTGALRGSAGGAATTTAFLRGAGRLSGTSAGVATAIGSLEGTLAPGAITGTAHGTSTAIGRLTGLGALAGAAAGTSSALGTLVAIDTIRLPDGPSTLHVQTNDAVLLVFRDDAVLVVLPNDATLRTRGT